MINTNVIIVEFISNNTIALSSFGILLIGLARVTGWGWLESIVGIFAEAINGIRGIPKKEITSKDETPKTSQ